MEQTNIKEWASKEAERIEEERKKKLQEKGYREFYTWRRGENKFEVTSNEEPRVLEGQYGLQKVFRIRAEDKDLDLPVNLRSPVYRMVVQGISSGKMNFNILKSGEGTAVRYELIE